MRNFYIAGIISFFIAYYPVWKSLLTTWSSSDEYSHGFFIIPLCCYIIWQKKSILANIPKKPSLWGLILIVISLVIYLFSSFAGIATLSSLSLLPLFAGIMIYLYGYLIFKELLFPFFLLLFMIPVPAQIYSTLTVPLQLFVSKISVGMASLIGVPIYREGNVIHLPQRTLEVVQACSGLRSMTALLTLSIVFGYFTLKSSLLRIILFFAGVPAAIIVNICRVSLMVLVFYHFDFDLTKGTIHTIFGLAIFILALIIIFMIKGVLERWDK